VDSAAGYRKALADLAAQAPPDVSQEIAAELKDFALPIPFLDIKG
jgi:hypothetical protein